MVVIAPAGAGVRDPLLIAALAPVIGYNPALAVMLVSRAVNTISDLLMAAVAFAGLRHSGTGVPVSTEAAGKAAGRDAGG